MLSFLKFEINEEIIEERRLFQKKVDEAYSDSPFVLKTDIKEEIFEQNGIKFLLKIMIGENHFAKKEININKKDFIDPFSPPFPDGYVIDDDFLNFNTHRIIFNKFPIIDKHLLLVTREFISQYTHLSFEGILKFFK